MRFNLEEAYLMPNGEFTKPHWDEWFDYDDHNAINQEEVNEHLSRLGEWTLIADPCGEISESDIIWWYRPLNPDKACAVSVKNVNDDTALVCIPGEEDIVFTIDRKECSTMTLHRRIADIEPHSNDPYIENVVVTNEDGHVRISTKNADNGDDIVIKVYTDYPDCEKDITNRIVKMLQNRLYKYLNERVRMGVA